MSLLAGESLGPYEIAGLIGAGGMGEVYRARDRRLDRTVAIKVLPDALSSRPDLRQRLEREARTISSLSHPHICTLYDVGSTPGGAMFLVMEYLEGESLADRLLRGPLPPRQALRIGAEIAEALDRAHRQQIVHRDLKPGNIMLTKSGVKLLDFGLAKLIANDETLSDPNTPTVARPRDVTEEGTIVGTLQYMAPEQLEGRVPDARADIFAFGATLYEMLTGQRAFQGNSRAAVMARILSDDPAPLPSSVPAPLARVVRHCLMKEPDERWQTARDVAIQLRGMLDGSDSGEAAAVVAKKRPAWRTVALALLMVAVGAAAALVWQRSRSRASDDPYSHVSLSLSPDNRVAFPIDSIVDISPDGTKLAAIAQGEDRVRRIYLRRFDSFELTPVAGTEEATAAFFSPSGGELAFVAGGWLQKLTLGSMNVERIARSVPMQGGSWGSDGAILFNPVPGGPIFRVPAAGGIAAPLPSSPPGELMPVSVPEEGFLFCVTEIHGKSFDEAEVVARTLDGKVRNVVARGTAPRYVAKTKQLYFARDGRIWMVPFDPKSLRTRGTPAVVAEPVLIFPGSGVALYDVSDDGDIVYAPYSVAQLDRRLMLVDRAGVGKPLPFPGGMYESPHLSADGKLLVIEKVGADNDVWLGNLERGTLDRVTSTFENIAPTLSPDGKVVIVSRHSGNMPRMYRIRTDGVGEPERLETAARPRFPYDWSRDGSTVAYMELLPADANIGLLRIRDGSLTPLLQSRFYEGEPALSADARWLAYVSDESGRGEVYVRSLTAEGVKVRVSTEGGFEPLFSHRGDELFFRNGDGFYVAKLTFTPTLTASTPMRLFTFPGTRRDVSRGYDLTPDDRHFVMIERAAGAESMRTLHVLRAR